MQRSKPLIFCCQESLPRISLSLTDPHAWTRGLFSSPILAVFFYFLTWCGCCRPDRGRASPRPLSYICFGRGGEVRHWTRLNISSEEHTQGKDLNRSHFGYCSMCAAAALYVFNVLRDCNNIMKKRIKCWIRKIAPWRMFRLKKKFFFVELELDGYSLVTSGVRRNMWRSSSLLRHLKEIIDDASMYQTNRQHCHPMQWRIISGHLHPGGRYLEVDHSTPAWVELYISLKQV